MHQTTRTLLAVACCGTALLTLNCLAQADESQALKLPKFKITRAWDDPYPDRARRLDQQGRVLVEFEISSKGRVVDPKIVSAEPPGAFESTVTALVRGWKFDVPSNWESLGGTTHAFHAGFIFILRPCRTTGPCDVAPFPADTSITITGSRLPLGSGR
jgi:TonB family protein